MRSTSDARWCITVGPLNVSLPPLWYEKRDCGFWMQGERRKDKEGLSGGTVKWVREKGVWLPGRGAAREREVWGESFFDGFDLRSKRRDEIEIGVLEVQFWAREIGLGFCFRNWERGEGLNWEPRKGKKWWDNKKVKSLSEWSTKN
jgi:hypothetical protein